MKKSAKQDKKNFVDQMANEAETAAAKGDQIFTLRNIIEQCIKWNSPLLINFIDFKKAFDSVNRKTLWKILRNYGIPSKLVTTIKILSVA